MTPFIRWMIRLDMPSVLSIEARSFEFAWTEEDFLRCLRQRDRIGMVAECDGITVGYMIYELQKGSIEFLNLAVDPSCRHRGVGAAMVDKLKSKLCHGRRTRLMANIRESNLDAQLFFRSQGFKAELVLRGFFNDYTGEDAYRLAYRLKAGSRVERTSKP